MRRHTRTKEDAALALVLSVLFGAGIALSRYVQSAVPGGGKAGLDSYILGKTAGIVLSDVILVSIICVFALAIVFLLFKEFRVVTFDADFARSLGWNTTALDFLVMSLVAVSVVVGLPMVGIVMVAALTILPAVSARFWVEDLRKMLLLSAALGVVSAGAGVLVSAQFSQMPTGPMVIIAAGCGFVASALLAPNRGLVAFLLRARAHQILLGARIAVKEASLAPLTEDSNTRLKRAGVRRSKASVSKALELGWLIQADAGLVPAGVSVHKVAP
jgi:manganese/zinc/iron transport system permease protein